MGPYSDIDCAILIADNQYKNHRYFKQLLEVLDFYLCMLGEPWIISSNDEQTQWIGLHIDRADIGLIYSSEELIAWLSAEFTTQDDFHKAIPMLQMVELYANNREQSLYVDCQKAFHESENIFSKKTADLVLKLRQEEYKKVIKKQNESFKSRYLNPFVFYLQAYALYYGIPQRNESEKNLLKII
jgi:hypothetical protein